MAINLDLFVEYKAQQMIKQGASAKDVHLLYRAHTFALEKQNGYYKSLKDLDRKKAKDNYSNFVNTILNEKIECYGFKSFNEIELAEIKEKFTEFTLYLYGNTEDIKQEINDYFNMVITTNSSEILSGTVYEIIPPYSKNKQIMVEMPNLKYDVIIVNLCASFHFYHMALQKKHYKVFEYGEIIRLFTARLVSYILEQTYKIEGMQQKVLSTKLDDLRWHYKENMPDLINMLAITKTISEPEYLIAQQIADYYNAEMKQLGLGFIYSENLFKEYMDNPKVFLPILRNALLDSNELINVLRAYNINAENEQVFKTATNNMQYTLRK